MTIKIAIFGQAAFGRDVAVRVAEAGHNIVGVYTPPAGARPDPLATEAEERGWPLMRHPRFRKKGVAVDSLVQEHAALGADLNLMPFTTVILPPEIVEAPPLGSLCFSSVAASSIPRGCRAGVANHSGRRANRRHGVPAR